MPMEASSFKFVDSLFLSYSNVCYLCCLYRHMGSGSGSFASNSKHLLELKEPMWLIQWKIKEFENIVFVFNCPDPVLLLLF